MPVKLPTISVRPVSDVYRRSDGGNNAPGPNIVWIWGGTRDAMYAELAKQQASVEDIPTPACMYHGASIAARHVQSNIKYKGGDFGCQVVMLDDSRNDFSRITPIVLQNMIRALFSRSVVVQGPNGLARRRIPNNLKNVFIISCLSPRAVLYMNGFNFDITCDVREVDLSPVPILR